MHAAATKTFIRGMINMVNLQTLSEIQGSGQPESKHTEPSARKWALSQCRPTALLTRVEKAFEPLSHATFPDVKHKERCHLG